jgi:hypothetical protein
MTRKTNHYNQIIKLLQQLHSAYPNYNMGRHISTALFDYGDFWGITDNELFYALNKYKTQLEMDVPHTDDKEIDNIIKEAMDLDNILKDEDNGDNY